MIVFFSPKNSNKSMFERRKENILQLRTSVYVESEYSLTPEVDFIILTLRTIFHRITCHQFMSSKYIICLLPT